VAAGAKNLEQIMLLTEQGLLAPGGAVCDIGASELCGGAVEEASASFLDYYRRKGVASKAHNGFDRFGRNGSHPLLGDLMEAAGFRYVALDIFHAKNTILFDLNKHEPGPELAGCFDLVLNFGTTEHVINQYLAHKSIYELLRIGGIAYHDLPCSGYFEHGYFKYNPMFFRHIAEANACDILHERVTAGDPAPMPADMDGAFITEWRDFGIEYVMVRRDPAPFRVGLETSTSLSVDERFRDVVSGEVRLAEAPAVSYGPVRPYAESASPVVPPPTPSDGASTLAGAVSRTSDYIRRAAKAVSKRLEG
jgi:hypothetical protein